MINPGPANTTAARRREVRRSIASTRYNWLDRLRRREVFLIAVNVVVFTVVGAMIAQRGHHQLRYQVDQVVTQPIVSRVQFRAIDQEATLIRKRNARDLEPAVYVPNTTNLQQLTEKLSALGRLGADPDIQSVDQIPLETRQALQLTPEAFFELRRYMSDDRAVVWDQRVKQFIDGLFGIAVLSSLDARSERQPTQLASKIIIEHPTGGEKIRHDEDLVSIVDDLKIFQARVELLVHNKLRRSLQQTLVAVVMQNPQPTYLLDTEKTEQRRNLRYEAEPPVEVQQQPNQVLVGAGEKLSPLDLQLIRQERVAYLKSVGPMVPYIIRPAGVGVLLLVSLGLWSYIARYKPKITHNAMRGAALTGLLLFAQGLAVIGTGMQPKLVLITATFPTLLVAIVIAIAYDQRFALAVGVIHALAVLLSLDLPMGFGLVVLAGVGMAANQLDDVRNRSTLIKIGLYCGIAMGVTTILVGFAQRPLHLDGEITRIWFDGLLAISAGLGTGLVVQGVLPTIEKLFKVTTSMTLRELNDVSHPLLRRLVQEAPGTYQHSLRIADMAQAAAKAIGANGLMCKVGAMYHDVGKINKPMYFVENQAGGPNRHNKLSPAMSLLIIVGHVKDGIEMAREYGLPRSLQHFIESHHGTTLVEYFYHAAKQQRDAENMPAPAEFEFRYPGPKPQTQEAAILMLCDGIEGASRAMTDPNASRIDQLVHSMANKRLMDGQFDECNLTLKQLHEIELSIVKTMCAIYHGRIAYPSKETDENKQSTPGGPGASASAAV